MRPFQVGNEPAYLFFDCACRLNFSGGMLKRHIQSRHERFTH